MSTESENMVLRTIYLPKDLDQTLKAAAIRGARTKGDLIRELILTGLSEKRKDAKSFFSEPVKAAAKAVRPSAPKGKIVAQAKPRVSRKKTATTA